MKTTPGPWKVYFENHKLRVDGEGKGDYRYICNMVQYGNTGKPLYYYKEELANAHLIASAPDLLEACEYVSYAAGELHTRNILKYLTDDETIELTFTVKGFKDIINAIQKAKGEE